MAPTEERKEALKKHRHYFDHISGEGNALVLQAPEKQIGGCVIRLDIVLGDKVHEVGKVQFVIPVVHLVLLWWLTSND